MSNPLQLFNTRNARFVDESGKLTREAISMFELLFNRVGGAVAPSTTDLAQSDDDDSGLEEFKHELSKGLDGLAMAPSFIAETYTDPLHPIAQEHALIEQLQTELAGLREEVNRLRTEVQGLQEGTYI